MCFDLAFIILGYQVVGKKLTKPKETFEEAGSR